MKELIRELVEAYGPSGFEDQVRDIIWPKIEPYADTVSVDAMGNLIATRNGSGEGLNVMIAAHMDEIGLMVSHVTEEGFLRFTNIGFVYSQTLLGNRVQFADGKVGVIHCDDSVLYRSTKDVQPLNSHFIDVGATGREDCPVEIGAAAGFKREMQVVGNRLTSKAMDDRIGCAVAIEALQRLGESPNTIHFVFSVQEEVGTRGAEAAANALLPDVGIALDVTTTGDTPEARTMAVSIGKGVAIKVKDSGMIAHSGLVRHMRARAEEAGIPYQLEVLQAGTTDARPMQVAGPGSASGCLSIPCRYVHSQSELVDLNDVEGAVKLLVEVLTGPIML